MKQENIKDYTTLGSYLYFPFEIEDMELIEPALFNLKLGQQDSCTAFLDVAVLSVCDFLLMM